MLALQASLASTGPTSELVARLVWDDLLLRAIPPTAQAGIQCWVLMRAK
jgi:hypothetical protein